MEKDKCKHVWDWTSRVWMTDGVRVVPCKKCSEVLKIGTIQVSRETGEGVSKT